MKLKFLLAGLLLAVLTTARAATVNFITYGSQWNYRLGTNEASSPVTLWRTNVADAAGWSAPATAPIGYGTPVPATVVPGSATTSPNWLCVFMRRTFVVTNPADIVSATLSVNIDDGYVAWINGTEVGRYNVPAGTPSTATAAITAAEPVVQSHAVSSGVLRAGTNVIAIQSFNANTTSSDHYVDASFTGTIDDTPPDVAFQLPYAGSTVTALSQIEVNFTEAVTGVDASDLLIGGVAATNVTATTSSIYLFRFPPKAPGTVNVQFAAGHNIRDLSSGAYPFAGASWNYIVDPNYVPTYSIRINELIAVNINGLRDENNEAQDWLELHNPGATLLSLAGWSLSDDDETPDKWVFPAVNIPAGGYLIVFCSEKDRKPTTPGSRLHSNFKLDPDGEFIGLYNAETPRQLVSSFNPYPNQRRDYSYGYDPGNQLKYFATPTPGAPNGNSIITGLVADTKFSHDRGFYTNGFFLAITSATPGAIIRYTRDGSPPTPSIGTIYAGPIQVTNTSMVRALAYKSGLLESDVDCHTYLFLDDVIRQPDETPPGAGWPAQKKVNGGGQNIDYGMDQSVVNANIATIRGDLMAIPSISVVLSLGAMFNTSTGIYMNPSGDTITWERPCSLELLQPDGEAGFQINCGIRIRGGFSRSPDNPKHAFRLFFRQEYGASKLNFPMFGPTGARSFDKFDLRTMQNYSWAFQGDSRMMCLRDVSSRDAQLTMNGTSTRGQFIHLYINGVYWGLYNTEERPEAAFAESYFGGNVDDYDVIKQLDGYTSGPTDGNTDAWYSLWRAATNGFASDADYFKVQGRNVDGTINTNYENLVDVPNMIDYMLVILYGGNLDAPISNFLGNDSPNNWYGFRDRTGRSGGFRFVSHDAEHTLLNVNEDRTGIIDLAGSGGQYGVINGDWTAGNPLTQSGGAAAAIQRSTPQYIWFRMHQNAEFRMLAADRIQKHCFNNGPLSVTGMRAALHVRSNELYRAINAEAARWGDAKNESGYNRSHWSSAYSTVYNSFVPGRTAVLINQLTADGLFPNVSAPTFNNYGGAVSNGFAFRMTNSNGGATLYYTLDGSDPRLRGGGISPTALAYTPGTPILITFPTSVRARNRGTTGVWSPITEAILYPGQDFSGLMISEIMYHSPAMGGTPGEDLEFIELKQTGTNTIDLTDIEFSDAINFTFPFGTRLAPGQFLVLGRNRAALTNKYPGLVVHGLYTGLLNNAGELIRLQNVFGAKVLSVDYKAGGRWPVTPDGFGFSLVPRGAGAGSANPDNPSYWRASTNPGGSPGADDPAAIIPTVLVNEALTHSTPLVDYVELYNPGGSPLDLGGWFVSDDRALPMKYRIPGGTMIGAGDYLILDESHFNPTPGTNGSFSLASDGEAVYLHSGDAATTNLTGYGHGFPFDAAPAGVSFGRHPISTGDEHFVLQSARTSGGANAGPAVGPVVIRQIMYHPPDLPGDVDDTDNEYVELRNTLDAAVPLYDPAFPTNQWRVRGGIGFDFPAGLSLGAHQSLLLVSFNPLDGAKLSAFRAKYGAFSGVPVYGPYSGQLDNSSDTVKLQRPDAPTPTNGVPYYDVDVVDYRDAAPWPSGPDGSGAALQRVSLAAYGNDPINWVGAAPLTIFSVAPGYIAVKPGTNAATATNVTFTVSAVGTGTLTYQWRKNGVNIGGATGTSLTLLDVQLADQGEYTVVVTDLSGSAVSPPAFLGVMIMPTFLQAPLSQSVVQGATVTLSAVYTGNPPPFTNQWNRDSIAQLITVTSATNVFYTFQATNNPGLYRWRLILKNAATAALGAPGGVSHGATADVTILADSDQDGIPDVWEAAYPDAASPTEDADGDGMNNRAEYIAGTNPTNAASYLRIDQVYTPGLVTLAFEAVTNRTYVIEYKDGLDAPLWSRLAELPARNTNRVETVFDPGYGTNRIYRVGTPRLP